MSLNQNPINEEGLNHLVIPPPDYSSLEHLHLCRVATHLLSESEREREREREMEALWKIKTKSVSNLKLLKVLYRLPCVFK